MTGFKTTLKPSLNIKQESDFILDFFPGIKNEDWKYTNLKKFIPDAITMQPFNSLSNDVLIEKIKSPGGYNLPKKNVVFFLDGVLKKDLSDIPSGLTINQLASNENNITSLYLNKSGTNFNTTEKDSYLGFLNFLNKTKLIELNTYLTNFPYLLSFSNSFSNQKPLKIIHGFSNKKSFFNQNRLLYLLEKNSNALIQEEIINFGKGDSVFNMVSEFICSENSCLDFYSTQNDLTNSSLINSVFCAQQKNSSSNFNVFSLNGKLIRNNFLVELLGSGSRSTVLGNSLLASSGHLDNFITISHLVEGCKSNQLFKSVFGGVSSGAFCGKIFVEKGAQRTEAFQQNNNLIVSKNARVNAKPQLEIFADDVVCSHGCTIGSIDEAALFYLSSRGIPKKEGINLLISAFVGELISAIQNNEIKKELTTLFLNNNDV